MFFQRIAQLIWEDRLSPLHVESPHVKSQTRRNSGEALAEVAIDGRQHLIPR
jgi:hypothetical protein